MGLLCLEGWCGKDVDLTGRKGAVGESNSHVPNLIPQSIPIWKAKTLFNQMAPVWPWPCRELGGWVFPLEGHAGTLWWRKQGYLPKGVAALQLCKINQPCTWTILFGVKTIGSQSVVPETASSSSPENWLEMQVMGPTYDLLNQKLLFTKLGVLTSRPSEIPKQLKFELHLPRHFFLFLRALF